MRCAGRKWLRALPWILGLCIAAGCAVGLFVLRYETPYYQAVYTLCAQPEAGRDGWSDMQMLSQDCDALTHTQTFRHAVLSDVSSDGRTCVQVKAQRGTHMLQIVATGPDAAAVQALANAVGDALIERIPRMFDVASAQEVERAQLPRSAANPPAKCQIAAAVLAVFLLGSLSACLFGSDRRRVRFDQPSAAPFCLGAVPDVRRAAKRFQQKNAKKSCDGMLLWQMDRLIRESLRRVLLRLRSPKEQEGGQCMVLAAVREEEESAAATVLLASEMAQQGFRVLLLEMDAAYPQLAGLLGVKAKADLHDYLLNHAEWSETIVSTPLSTLVFIDWLHPDVEASALAATDAFAAFLKSARSHFDWVLLHAAPTAACADAAMLSLVSDGMVLMAQDDQYEQKDIEKAARLQAQLGRPAKGVVFTGVRRDRLENAD